jgi:hypothetical protein
MHPGVRKRAHQKCLAVGQRGDRAVHVRSEGSNAPCRVALKGRRIRLAINVVFPHGNRGKARIHRVKKRFRRLMRTREQATAQAASPRPFQERYRFDVIRLRKHIE